MSRKIASVVAAASALLVGAGALSPAPAQADTRVPVTPSTTFTGEGFGHGKGLSQYGARNRAEQGQSPKTILDFYYPGTAQGTLTGRIRVLVTADTDDNTTVRAAQGLRLTDTGRARTWTLPTSLNARAWRLRMVDGAQRVFYKVGTTWRLHKPGGHAALRGDGQFSSTTGVVMLRLPSVDRPYRGALRFSQTNTVNVVGFQKYLYGVVPAEMPALWHQNALQAQSVAARTYAAFDRAAHASRYYHTCDTTSCQVYRGYAAEQPQTNAAVNATKGVIRTYGGVPAFTQFSASNGGYSVKGSQPYLVAKPDPYDNYPTWTKPLDVAKVQSAYPALGTLEGITILTRDGKGDFGGRVLTLRFDGHKGAVATSVTVSGDTVRSLLGLRSTLFKVS